MNAGLRRQAERLLDVLQSMARGNKSPMVREQMMAIVDAQRPRVDSMPRNPNRGADRPSKSVRTVNGGLPTLGRRWR